MFDKLVSAIPVAQRRRAEKCVVRECDETEKNTFIAYVDEGSDTFDVSLTFQGEALIASGCDCKQHTNLCQHKAALLLYIANPPTKKATTVKVKKTDPVISLLATIEPTDLKEWLGTLLLNNKDIRLAFELQFAPTAALTIEDIVERTKSAVKTVVKNKKNVDVNQLKKIIDLWLKIHEPLLKEYYGAVYSKEAFLRFHAALKTCSLEQLRMITQSNKILSYISDRVNQGLEPIINIVHEDQWQQAITLIFDGIEDGTHYLKMCYLGLLKNLLEVSETTRAESLLRQMMARYRSILAVHPVDQVDVATFFLQIVVAKSLFNKYRSSFTSIDYAAAYNYQLIDALISAEDYQMAEKICINEIKFHAKNTERVKYYEWLVKIYEATGQEKKKLESVQRLFPFTFYYDQYRYVYDALATGKERDAWRGTALKLIQYPSKFLEQQAVSFRLSLAIVEADEHTAMLLIENGCPYVSINEHKERLAATFRHSFLPVLVSRYDDKIDDLSLRLFDLEMNAVEELVKFVLREYGVEVVTKTFKAFKSKRKTFHAQFPSSLEAALASGISP